MFPFTRHARAAVLCVLPATLPAALSAQTSLDRLTIHGSVNTAYAKSSELPVIGIPVEGTSDYRVVTLQLRYALDDNDHFVIQGLNRRIGTSPLRAAVPDVSAQWAYWQHSTGDVTVKLGRAPLPRGLLNEVRYIGTVIPFYRIPYEFSYDAFDAVDGAVVSWRKHFADSWSFQAHAIGGGTENRNVRSEANGLSVRISKANNLRGGQLYLDAPHGVRLGLYGDRYERIDETTKAKGLRNHHAFSGEIEREYVTLRAEHLRETGYGSNSDLRNSYVDLILKPSTKFHLGVERSIGDQMVFPDAEPSFVIPAVRSTGVVGDYFLTSNTVLKFEHHWRNGYQYDAFVPPSTVVNGATMVLPPARTNYWIASAALSF